jgi:serine protease Do
LGRWNEKLPGDGAEFWGLVPENYHPEYSHGLLLWLHPAGDTMEAEVARALQAVAAERGWIIVGPRATSRSGWTPEEEEVAKGIVDWVRERYRIDPSRIAVCGHREGGDFAARLAFKYRDLFRGAILSEAPVRSAPPPTDPDYRLQLRFLQEAESPLAEPIAGAVDGCRQLKFPTALQELAENQNLLSAPAVVEWWNWLDALDRL